VRRTLVSLLAALLVAAGGMAYTLHAAAPARSATAPVRIMPLGDSITGSPGCWRALLWNRLQASGYTNIDFVGTLPAQGCGVPYDGDNEGHGGYLATNIANQNLLPGWLSATLPDVVVMHLGTNDVWSSIAPATILAAFSTLVAQMRASNPNMKILVAQILPMNPSTCADCASRVVAFNAAIPAWAAGISTAASPVTVVDQWTGFSDATDTYDGVHPNDAGNQKISDRWYPPLAALLSPASPSPTASASRSTSPSASPSRSASPSPSRSVSPSPSRSVSPSASPSRSTSPSASASPSPTGAAGCTAVYSVVGQWQGGFQGQVVITNGSAARSAWRASFTFTAGQQITQVWSATVTQSGSGVTATNLSWNGALAPGASTTFGFLGNWTGTNPVPTVSCT
jgi:lysophospholipase L1-like esterase